MPIRCSLSKTDGSSKPAGENTRGMPKEKEL